MRFLVPVVGVLALLAQPALAQQPAALPGAPQPTNPLTPTTAPPSEVAPTLPAQGPGEVVGQAYSVDLRSGTSFSGTLRAATVQDLTFDTRELGTVTVQRYNLRQLVALTPAQARRGYGDVGNGTRLLFGPTARNLRRGEGYLQDAYVFILGVNYGVTDNFSIGALFTAVPGVGSDNFFTLTPKASAPVGENLRLGGGAIIGLAGGGAFGITYANSTYGSADHNLTLGLGYGFADGAFASTPVIQLGGATRVSRRVSLMNETYFFRTDDGYYRESYVFGIAGVRLTGERLSGSLGGLYAITYNSSTYYGGGSSGDGGVLPYAEISYRFGRIH